VATPYSKANPDKIRASGLQIYRDCGDEDMFLLFEGSEFLHRVLYDARIKHEYHLVLGADHLGRTVRPWSMEALPIPDSRPHSTCTRSDRGTDAESALSFKGQSRRKVNNGKQLGGYLN